MSKETNNDEINLKLYDRQIRLWGIDAQKRMASSRVLVYGITGLSAEVCKNIVLSGVGNVCIMDNGKVTPSLLGSNFFINEKQIGENVRILIFLIPRERKQVMKKFKS